MMNANTVIIFLRFSRCAALTIPLIHFAVPYLPQYFLDSFRSGLSRFLSWQYLNLLPEIRVLFRFNSIRNKLLLDTFDIDLKMDHSVMLQLLCLKRRRETS